MSQNGCSRAGLESDPSLWDQPSVVGPSTLHRASVNPSKLSDAKLSGAALVVVDLPDQSLDPDQGERPSPIARTALLQLLPTLTPTNNNTASYQLHIWAFDQTTNITLQKQHTWVQDYSRFVAQHQHQGLLPRHSQPPTALMRCLGPPAAALFGLSTARCAMLPVPQYKIKIKYFSISDGA